MKTFQMQPRPAQMLRQRNLAADFSGLQQVIADLTAQAAQNTSLEGSATQIITGIAAAMTDAVTKALTADAAANQGSIDVAKTAISGVKDQFVGSAAPLAAAIAANTPSAPTGGAQ